MWGTDITQHDDKLTHCEAVSCMRYATELSQAEKEQIMGETLCEVVP